MVRALLLRVTYGDGALFQFGIEPPRDKFLLFTPICQIRSIFRQVPLGLPQCPLITKTVSLYDKLLWFG